jgi:hypothetical protein
VGSFREDPDCRDGKEMKRGAWGIVRITAYLIDNVKLNDKRLTINNKQIS